MKSLLIISGLDPSGGAGLLADVRVADAHGYRAVGVATGHTVQNSCGVRSVYPSPVNVVAEQLRTLLSDVEVVGVKVGMLAHCEMARAIGDALALTDAPIVWDPVVHPSIGRGLLFDGPVQEACEAMRGHLTLITPNLAEAELLTGSPVVDIRSMRRAAAALAERWETSVLVTGGHLVDAPVDVLWEKGQIFELAGERVVQASSVHGTGCALSTAIAARLATGDSLADAAQAAAGFVRDRLRRPISAGRGRPSLM
jgi:hydroxymethylpyrimidine/phosphomethylpyrimidine kinase